MTSKTANCRKWIATLVAHCCAGLIVCQFSLTPAAAQAEAPVNSALRRPANPAYVIGPGDVLQIIVEHEPDASIASVVVRPDGLISLPILKQVSAAGMTPHDLEANLATEFAKFIREPDVTVLVREIHSEKIYVIGAVRKEGAINLQGPLTVLQALAEAGGITDYAKRSRIYVLRSNSGKQERLHFDYSAVIRGEHSEQNILLQPGDSIVVPQ